ncbi:MAG: helix-turn-helix domain-containing protein [Rhodospirillaceae bacterium]
MAVEKFQPRRPLEVKDPMTAGEFNLWCAIHDKPYRMARHQWPDGATEWDVEYNPNKPDGTIAYGTGQEDETLATLAAFAFIAGVEWAEDARRPAEDDDEEPAAVVAPPPVAAPATAEPSLYARALALAMQAGTVSPRQIEDALGISQERANRLAERMEDEGIAGAPDATGTRVILVSMARLPG